MLFFHLLASMFAVTFVALAVDKWQSVSIRLSREVIEDDLGSGI